MEDDEPDMIIIKDETFDDGPGKSKPQTNSRSSEKGAVHDNLINRILTAYINNVHIILHYFNAVQTLLSRAWNRMQLR